MYCPIFWDHFRSPWPTPWCIHLSKIDAAQCICIVKPKCILVLKKFQVLCQKSPVESRYPELIYKRYCLHPPGYLVQRHLCFVDGVSLPLEARKEFLAERNLFRFHYTWLNRINSTEIEALWHCCTLKGKHVHNYNYT